jgi:hypothetical protein
MPPRVKIEMLARMRPNLASLVLKRGNRLPGLAR